MSVVEQDLWRRELRLGPGGYASRPQNVLKPLLFGARVVVRTRRVSARSWDDSGVQVKARRWHMGVDSISSRSVYVTAGGRLVAATVWLPKAEMIPAAMRSCLQGTGYRMGRAEKLLAALAYRLGLRADRVIW